jgi:hypothetical protein
LDDFIPNRDLGLNFETIKSKIPLINSVARKTVEGSSGEVTWSLKPDNCIRILCYLLCTNGVQRVLKVVYTTLPGVSNVGPSSDILNN